MTNKFLRCIALGNKFMAMVAIFMVIYFVYFGYRSYLNLTGYCWEEGRYLNNNEKIYRVLEHVLKQYPPSILPMESEMLAGVVNWVPRDTEYYKNRRPGSSWMVTKPENPIVYENITQFLTENPGCCELRPIFDFTQSEGPAPTLVDKITGNEFEFIKVKYWVKFLHEGAEQKIETTYYAGLSNCATPHPVNQVSHY